jgi:hypothetical protein
MKRALAVVLAVLSSISFAVVGAASPVSAEGEYTIRGTVTDEGGAPLAGVNVSTWYTSQVTGADGTYVLENQYDTWGTELMFSDPSGLHAGTSLTAFPSETETVVVDVVLLASTPSVYGRVTDPDGNGIGGVTVRDVTAYLRWAVTNPDGYYGLSDLSGVLDFSAESPHYRPQTITGVEVQEGVPYELNFELQEYAKVELTVTAGGLPANASVTLWRDLEFDNPAGGGATDSNGNLSINVREDGEYYLQLSSGQQGYTGEFYPDTVYREEALRFAVTGDEVVVVEADLEAEAIITGTLLMPDGSPGDSFGVNARPVGIPDNSYDYPFPCNLPEETDPPGTFRIGCLHPSADWVLKGFGLGQADNEYYEDSQSAANATPIAVDEGQTVSGLVIQLDPLSPDPTFTGLSQSYFVTGTTTPGVRVYGSNFPSDPNALKIETDFWFFGVNVFFEVTSIVSSSEAIATVTVTPGEVGPEPVPKMYLSLTREYGGNAQCTCQLFYGDPSTQVATITGRVTDNKSKPVPYSAVQVRWPDPGLQGGYGIRTFSTGPDGRFIADGLSPRTYQVVFLGSETLAGEWWNDKHNTANATSITLAAGQTRTNVNAQLAQRGAITITKATPRFQTFNLDFELVGEGLSPIKDNFRVFIDSQGFLQQLQVASVSNSRLRVTGSHHTNGTFDIVTQWTAANGTIKENRCVGCLSTYSDLAIYPPWDPNVPRGAVTPLYFEGSGLADITKVQVSGTRVGVVSYSVNEWGFLTVTFDAKPNAAAGPRTLTITRKDGSTATTVIQVV